MTSLKWFIVNAQTNNERQRQILQFMTTEHFALQTAKSATIAEANGRSALFIGSVSSGVVALAFVGQVAGMGEAFLLFGLVLFPSLFFLGVVTFGRLVQTGNENLIYAREIGRIRHYYIELAPEMKRYFIQSIHDDAAGAARSMGIVPSSWQLFIANAGMAAVINSVLVGVFAGMLCRFAFAVPVYASFGLGIAFFLLSVLLHRRWQLQEIKRVESRLNTLFPSDFKDERERKAE